MSKRVKTEKRARVPYLPARMLCLIGSFTDFGTAARARVACKALSAGVKKTWTRQKIDEHCANVVKKAYSVLQETTRLDKLQLPGFKFVGEVPIALHGPMCFCEVCRLVSRKWLTGHQMLGFTECILRLVDCLIWREMDRIWSEMRDLACYTWPNGPCGEHKNFVVRRRDVEVRMGISCNDAKWNAQKLKQWLLDETLLQPDCTLHFEGDARDIRAWRKGVKFTETELNKVNYKKLDMMAFDRVEPCGDDFWLYKFVKARTQTA